MQKEIKVTRINPPVLAGFARKVLYRFLDLFFERDFRVSMKSDSGVVNDAVDASVFGFELGRQRFDRGQVLHIHDGQSRLQSFLFEGLDSRLASFFVSGYTDKFQMNGETRLKLRQISPYDGADRETTMLGMRPCWK